MLLELNDITDNSYQQINGIFIHPDICLNSVVYKYIKREHLHEMIQNHQLYVANRKSFSDRREQHFKENLQKRFIIAPASIPSYNKNYYKTLSKKIDEAYSLCIPCWTYDKHKNCDESILNWKCYGENTCRIETSIEDLILSIHPTDKIIVISPVSYEKNEYDSNVFNAIFKKHISYQEEQEIRMCILSSANNELLNIDTEKLIHKIRLSPLLSVEQNEKEKKQLESIDKNLSSIIEYSHLYER